MPKALDITGKQFGKLTAIKRVENKGGKTYWLCRCECGNEKEVQTSHLTRGLISSCGCGRATIPTLMSKLSDEEFANVVAESSSLSEIVKKCGFTCVSGASEKIIKDRIQNLSLDISHFRRTSKKNWTPEDIFILNSQASQSTLRRYYKDGNYTEYKCSICGQEPFWNGKELTLTLDHKNGQNHDDRLENLRWVCPNCDRQLDTFGGRNRH